MFNFRRNLMYPDHMPTEWGYVAICALTIAFGTMYIPAKKFDIGNGMIYQWIMCTFLSFALFVIHLCIGSPKIWPLATLSGFFWSTGNITVVPIIKRLGLGVGMLTWSMINLLMGWASSRFGWFGIQPEVPKNNALNITGVTLAAMSVVVYAFITPASVAQETGDEGASAGETGHTLGHNVDGSTRDDDPLLNPESTLGFRPFWRSEITQRIVGFLMALLSGILYGIVFVPIIYAQENYHGASHRGIDYVASLGLGAFMGSTFYLTAYALWMRWKNGGGEDVGNGDAPLLLLLLPAMVSGSLCALGQACWLVANEALQASITFPIAATLPGALATFLGAFFFHEVQGMHNYIKLAVAMSLTFSGSVLTGLSK